MPLTLAQASTIVDVALKTGREAKLQPLAVAVLDAGGHRHVEQVRKQVIVIRWFCMEGPSLNGQKVLWAPDRMVRRSDRDDPHL